VATLSAASASLPQIVVEVVSEKCI